MMKLKEVALHAIHVGIHLLLLLCRGSYIHAEQGSQDVSLWTVAYEIYSCMMFLY